MRCGGCLKIEQWRVNKTCLRNWGVRAESMCCIHSKASGLHLLLHVLHIQIHSLLIHLRRSVTLSCGGGSGGSSSAAAPPAPMPLGKPPTLAACPTSQSQAAS
jgi:hypothetical protein